MSHHWIISCLLLIAIISGSHGYPGVGLINAGTDLDANWKLNGMFRYNSGREDDPGVNIDARSSGDWFGALGFGAGAQVGRNGKTGGSGLAVAAKTAAKTGGNVRAGVVGNWHERNVQSGIDLGAGVKKATGVYAGVFWDNPQQGDHWGSLNHRKSNYLKRK